MVNVPHFDFPMRFGADGHIVTIEQNSEKDLINCVYAALKTDLGSRLYVPGFGIEDPVFELAPIGPEMINQIKASEPRADVLIQEHLDDLTDYVTVGVGV